MRPNFLLASLPILAFGCLDFDVFRTEPATGSTGSAGGAGGATTSGSTTSTGASDGGGGAGGGTGGGGGAMQPETEPCAFGGTLTDTFEGPELDWLTTLGTVDYSNDTAILMKPPGSEIELDRNLHAGVLDECHFQIQMVKADVDVVYVQFRSVANPLGQNFGFHVINGVPHAQLVPGNDDLTLQDNASMTSGYVRIGEQNGSYFIMTAESADGPWLVRYETTSVPQWLAQPGFLVVGISSAGGAPDTAIFDNLNL